MVGVTEGREVQAGAGEEAFEEAGPVMHPFEPGLHQGGQLADVVLGQVGLTVASIRCCSPNAGLSRTGASRRLRLLDMDWWCSLTGRMGPCPSAPQWRELPWDRSWMYPSRRLAASPAAGPSRDPGHARGLAGGGRPP